MRWIIMVLSVALIMAVMVSLMAAPAFTQGRFDGPPPGAGTCSFGGGQAIQKGCSPVFGG